MHSSEPTYFVRVSGIERGPLTAQQLRALARANELSLDDEVRKSQSSKWTRAALVGGLWGGHEIRAASPRGGTGDVPGTPPPTTDPSWIEAPPIPDVAIDRDGEIDPEEVAAAQRWLIRSLAAYLGAFVVFPLLIVLIPVQLWCLGRLVRALRWSGLSSASAITGTLIPYLGMAPLFIANQSATKVLTECGYVVGFWGARRTPSM